jgi:putative nucleotidyltransferase with HDIG domain
MPTELPIRPDQLCIGLYLRLDPNKKGGFSKTEFLIKEERQIEKLKKLDVQFFTVILEKSKRMPLPPDDEEADAPSAGPAAEKEESKSKTPVSKELFGLKKETVERNKERRKRYAACEKRYDNTMHRITTVLRRVSAQSQAAVSEAEDVVKELVGPFLSDRDAVINLMSSRSGEEQKVLHSLNVAVLSIMIGSELKLEEKYLKLLGFGALLHDIGKGRIPMNVIRGQTLDQAAAKYYREHPAVGVRLISAFPDISPHVVSIVHQHHELTDGSGYPRKLAGDKISPLARIVAVVNIYDNLLNDPDKERLTPHEAVKVIYRRYKDKLDPKALKLFIRSMGVYPPGTVVELSNGIVGIVTATNPKNAARPTVLVYHKDVPKNEALMVDLMIEQELNVERSIKPDDLPREIFNYLRPSTTVNYYADTAPEKS